MNYKRYILIIFFTWSILQGFAVEAVPYGGNQYGESLYSGTEVNQSNPVNTTATPMCNFDTPSFAPNLYQVSRFSTKAILYFAPAGRPYNSYVIAYGYSSDRLTFGVTFNQEHVDSALSYTINALDPRKPYSFKIRGAHNCAPGEWSNIINTKPNTTKRASIYYRYTAIPSVPWYKKLLSTPKKATVTTNTSEPKIVQKSSVSAVKAENTHIILSQKPTKTFLATVISTTKQILSFLNPFN